MFKTALHSSFDRESGYDIFCEAGVEVPNKEPRNGIEGIDLKMVVREKGAIWKLPRRGCWKRAVVLLNV